MMSVVGDSQAVGAGPPMPGCPTAIIVPSIAPAAEVIIVPSIAPAAEVIIVPSIANAGSPDLPLVDSHRILMSCAQL
jgi:hypothetical protein